MPCRNYTTKRRSSEELPRHSYDDITLRQQNSEFRGCGYKGVQSNVAGGNKSIMTSSCGVTTQTECVTGWTVSVLSMFLDENGCTCILDLLDEVM